MPRKLFLVMTFFSVLSITPGVLVAQSRHCNVPATEKAIQHGAEVWKKGYNEGNAAQVANLYVEDATYLTQHFVTGIVQGRDRIQAYVQRGVDAKYHIDSINVLSSGCSGKMAYAITRYESTNGSQKAFGVNVLVLQKVGSQWLIVAHESAVPDPANAIQSLDVKNQ